MKIRRFLVLSFVGLVLFYLWTPKHFVEKNSFFGEKNELNFSYQIFSKGKWYEEKKDRNLFSVLDGPYTFYFCIVSKNKLYEKVGIKRAEICFDGDVKSISNFLEENEKKFQEDKDGLIAKFIFRDVFAFKQDFILKVVYFLDNQDNIFEEVIEVKYLKENKKNTVLWTILSSV